MAYMPLIIPDSWETILNSLFMHKPHNGWHTLWGFQQTLCGNMAVCFLNCREVCRGFDFYMLTYLGRFTMRPIRALRLQRHSRGISPACFAGGPGRAACSSAAARGAGTSGPRIETGGAGSSQLPTPTRPYRPLSLPPFDTALPGSIFSKRGPNSSSPHSSTKCESGDMRNIASGSFV